MGGARRDMKKRERRDGTKIEANRKIPRDEES